MIYYQSRYLADRLSINLAKWKRWVRDFLPPDPLGGMQSGYARQFCLKDAFQVYLGGFLVAELKFSIPEASQILSDLSPWLKKNGYFRIHVNNGDHIKLLTAQTPLVVIFIFKRADQAQCYAIRETGFSGCTPESTLSHETYTIDLVGTDVDPLVDGRTTSSRLVVITALYQEFLKKLVI